MKKLFLLLSISVVIISCSTNETSTPVTPPPVSIVKYTISFSAGEGGTVSTTGGEYEAGETVSVTATPQGEYVFTNWSDGNTNATRTITVNLNSTLTANFEKRKYPLTINFEGEGEVIEEIVNTGRTTDYDSGTTVKLIAQPESEWIFTGWSGDIGDVDPMQNPIQISIINPKTITATFQILETTQWGYDQPTISYKNLALIPLSFNDVPNAYSQDFPSKNELKDALEEDIIRDYLYDQSNGQFTIDITVFDYVNLERPGIIDGTLYSTEIITETTFVVEGFDFKQYDGIIFVPVYDQRLSGGRANVFNLSINGENIEQYPVIFNPVQKGIYDRNTNYNLSNTLEDKKGFIIPLGENSEEEGQAQYSLSNYQQTFIHELIHYLGIGTHAFSRTNGSRFDFESEISNNNNLLNLDYGNKFCIMGSGEYAINLTAAFKDYLGWIPELKKEKLTDYGSFELSIYPTSNQLDRPEIVEIRMPNQKNEFSEFLGRKNSGYFIEVLSSENQWSSFLNNANLNQNIDGVFVSKTDGFNSWLLDMSPSPNIDFYGQITPDIRDVVLKPGMIYENQEITINNITKNQDGSFSLEIIIKD